MAESPGPRTVRANRKIADPPVLISSKGNGSSERSSSLARPRTSMASRAPVWLRRSKCAFAASMGMSTGGIGHSRVTSSAGKS